MFDEMNRFVIRNYQQKPPFSSFLPGIAGETGVPAWCYYNNRGQGVCSFGARDKDHAIMEFSPAHVAYRDVSRTGFRTFSKVNGQYQELFTENCDMHIGMSELEIRCCQNGLNASALYFGIPNERTAAIARILTVQNNSNSDISLELLDGMAAIVPYGLNQDFLKNMTQLSKAWMQAEDHDQGRAYFRVRASLEDGAVVREVKGGNFCLGWDDEGNCLHPIVQPSLVFGEDTAMASAGVFQAQHLDTLTRKHQVTSNQFLCCFLPKSTNLAAGKSITLYSIYGQAENKQTVFSLQQRIAPVMWFSEKRKQANALTDQITAPISCKTGNPVFDAYAKQTYLDNALRGGAPMTFRDGEKSKPFHIYSRKHGDPEREYNYFSLGMEYYAQGNGNYRDVNQNRRCDVLFSPDMGSSNIFTFFDLIQTDGYNPLVLTPSTYSIPAESQSAFLSFYPQLSDLLTGSFTPGQIAMALEDIGVEKSAIPSITARIICASDSEPNADFAEGYWCDHWTYNLDLIESYLSIYPEKKDELLFTENTCRWYETRVFVNPRRKRYAMTQNGLRQYYALNEHAKKPKHKWMHTADGTQASSSLIEKILLLCAIKTATLDAAGMGIEMEGGRPGWYDALNGLPGLFGSSMAESCELARLLAFAVSTLENKSEKIALYTEIADMIDSVAAIIASHSDPFCRWDAMNHMKETYRQDTLYGYQGQRVPVSCTDLVSALRCMEAAVLQGIEKAKEQNNGLIPTYFTFTADAIDDNMPGKLTPTVLPLFLEGPVRWLKLPLNEKQRADLVQKVRNSGLYDEKLKMYKVNESLSGVSFEAGRALAFTPGWLENESVWLHMEYKYLLELLKCGLYDEFSEAFHDAAIPFLDPAVYGRSPLENVSFIASSANPDDSIHGRGFVSRLSGSTAEFVHMWHILFFGNHPFLFNNGNLTLQFEPFIPSYLMRDDGILEATFLGSIPVVYHTSTLTELIPQKTSVKRYVLTYPDESTQTYDGPVLPNHAATAVRNREIARIDVVMQ